MLTRPGAVRGSSTEIPTSWPSWNPSGASQSTQRVIHPPATARILRALAATRATTRILRGLFGSGAPP